MHTLGEKLTGEIGGQFPVAEPPGRLVVLEVPPVWREICLEQCIDVVIVPHIDRRVTEGYDGGNKHG